ncbi:MAG: hypothetical protein ACI92S_003981 [Planctomycetaceae bacterium]|jgi:hypothetical protein
MGHEYPQEVNWNSTWTDVFTTHSICLSLILCFVALLFLSRRWPAKQSSVWAWALAIPGALIAVAFAIESLDSDTERAAYPYFAIYKAAFWLIGLVGMRMTHRRLKAENKASPFGFGFLICLLAIFGFFFVLVPSHVQPREAARRTQCKSNLKQIGIALHNFHDVHGHFPPSPAGAPLVSWRVHALPYLDNPDLFETYDQTLAWNSNKNTVIAKQRIEQLTCPSTRTTKDTLDRWYTHYAMISGQKTIGDRQYPRSFSDFTDGTANTLAVVEAAGLNIVWTEPRDSEVSDGNLGINLTGPTPTESPALISAWHRGGGHVLMADGAAKFLSHNIDPKVLKALTTVDGDDSIEGWDAR